MALWPDPDATTSAKGIVKLAGDLAGTADLPTVPSLTTKALALTATAVKTANYSAVAGDMVRADASGGTFAVTLPASTIGALVGLKKVDATATAVTFSTTGGDTVDGVSSGSLTLTNQSRIFLGVSGGWTVPYGLNTLVSLDARYPLDSTLTTKGDSYVASAASTPARFAVGSDGQIPVADSAQTLGQKWAAGAPSATATGLTGTTQGRFVGVVAHIAPTSGTFSVADYVVTQDGNMLVCVVAGSPGVWVSPSDLKDGLTTGEETFSRNLISINSGVTTSQNVRMSYFTARKSETTTQVRVISGSAAAGATPTFCAMGLYLIDPSTGDGTLVASTANDTSLFATTNTVYTRSWQASYAKVAGQRYSLGVLVVTAAALPTLTGNANNAGLTAEWGVAPRLTGTLTGQSTLPSTFTAGSVAASLSRHYGAILP